MSKASLEQLKKERLALVKRLTEGKYSFMTYFFSYYLINSHIYH